MFLGRFSLTNYCPFLIYVQLLPKRVLVSYFFYTKDRKEDMTAFVKKRNPTYTGEWSPTGKARGTSMKYPPTPMGAEMLRTQVPGLRRVIRQ